MGKPPGGEVFLDRVETATSRVLKRLSLNRGERRGKSKNRYDVPGIPKRGADSRERATSVFGFHRCLSDICDLLLSQSYN